MYSKIIRELKEKTRQAQDFGDPWNYFFDHLGENDAFLASGEPVSHPLLSAVVAQIAQQIFKKTVAPDDALFIRVPGEDFIHGACFVGGRMLTLFYFEDIDLGLLAVNLGSENTVLARFTCKQATDEEVFAVQPMTSDEKH